MLNDDPPFEPRIYQHVRQRYPVAHQVLPLDAALHLLQETPHFLEEVSQHPSLLQLGAVEYADHLHVYLTNPHPHPRPGENVCRDQLAATGEGLGQVPAHQLALGQILLVVDQDRDLALRLEVSAQGLGVALAEIFGLGVLPQASRHELGRHFLLDGCDEGSMGVGAELVVDDLDSIVDHFCQIIYWWQICIQIMTEWWCLGQGQTMVGYGWLQWTTVSERYNIILEAMMKPYKERYSFEERGSRVKSFQESDPDKIMVIVERHHKSSLPDLQNSKFLTFKTFKYGQVKALIEKRVKQKLGKEKEAKESYYLFVNGCIPNIEDTMLNVYEKYKDTDGILYITYQEQHSF